MVKFLNNNSGFNSWMSSKTAATSKKTSKFSSFLWWMVIFILAWWLFSSWLVPKKEEAATPAVIPVEDVSNVATSTISGDKISANVQGLRVSDIELKDYVADKKTDPEKKIVLLSGDREFIEVGLIATGTNAPTINTEWKTKRVADADVSTWRNSDGIDFTRTVSAQNYIITVRDEIKNNSRNDITAAPYANIVRNGEDKTVAISTGGMAYANSDLEKASWKNLDKKSQVYQTNGGFVGFADQYWETVASVHAPDQTMHMKKIDARYSADTVAAPVRIAAGKIAAIETKIFAGPRDQSILGAAADSIAGISETIDYGWFWFLARPMLWMLNVVNGIVLNYGLAIIILTIILRVLIWPLTRKSYTSMAAMQKMQPELQRIQKLYANDKPRQQMEMMKLYQEHKTSPMSGCLPMLLQIPIFFALYKALMISVPMRGAGFLWMSDLSVMDPYFILPILMGATMWWQQTLQSTTPKNADKNDPMAQTQKIMKWMPLIFTAMFAWMPAGLVLYWTVSNLFGIGQMYVIKRK